MLVLAVLSALHPGAASPRPSDATEVRSEATRVLQALLRIPSVNPPGGELPAAQHLAQMLRDNGIDVIVLESSPGRGNVMARLEGNGARRPILLLCHLDVVPVEPGWSVDPFSGVIREGSVYGRGAIDDKGMCTSNLIAFLELERREVELTRDVVFMATADEEGVGEGLRFMLDRFPDLDVEFVLNEGGAGIIDAINPGQIVFGVAAGDKGFARIRLVARNRPGHGGTPTREQAPHALITALSRLRAKGQPLVFHEYVGPMLRRLGEEEGGLRGLLMRHPGPFSGLLLRAMTSSPGARAIVSNTISVVELSASGTVATVPAEAEAWLDVRLLPGVEPGAFRDQIGSELDDLDIRVELERGWSATTSPWDTELSRALERQLPVGVENGVVVPIMGMAWTDSRFFRERGAIAYGIFPFVLSQAELANIHGHDEHLPIDELEAGVSRTYRVLVEVAGP